MRQPSEGSGEIFVLIVDETYGQDEGTWEQGSERYRQELEREFGSSFKEANIGPGADLPAFLTVLSTTHIPLWAALLGAFFAGKSVSESLAAWADIGRAIRRFFSRPVMLGRHGASVLAVEAVMDALQGTPKAIRLLSYRVAPYGDEAFLAGDENSRFIGDAPDTLFLGVVLHVFEIEADGACFRVSVDGKEVKLTHRRG